MNTTYLLNYSVTMVWMWWLHKQSQSIQSTTDKSMFAVKIDHLCSLALSSIALENSHAYDALVSCAAVANELFDFVLRKHTRQLPRDRTLLLFTRVERNKLANN